MLWMVRYLPCSHTLADDVPYSKLSADIFASIDDNSFVIAPSTLSLKSELTDVFVSAQYDERLQLEATLEPDTVKNVTALLPTELMGKQTYQYLMRALNTESQTGTVKHASLLWDGVPSEFLPTTMGIPSSDSDRRSRILSLPQIGQC